MFLAPKMKYSLTADENGVIDEHRTVKSFTNSQRLLDRNHFFEKLKGEKTYAKLPFGWKIGFDSGIIIT